VTFPSIKSTRPYGDGVAAGKLLLARWFPELADEQDGTFHVGRVFPNDRNLIDILPFVRIRDIGGNDNGLSDRQLIDFDFFHKTYREVRELADEARTRLLSYPHVAGSTVIDQVSTAMRPHDVPWDDDRIYRQYSSFTFSVRR